MAVKMDAQARTYTLAREINEDFRVRLTSKKQAIEQMNQYKVIFKKALDGQTGVPEKTKGILLEELQTDFEAAVQANVLVNGQTWDDAPNDDEEDKLARLEKTLDDAIVETACKRRAFPPKILRFALRSLKAERQLLDFYEKPVKSQLMLTDAQTENLMKDLSDRTSGLAKHATEVIKSIHALQNQARLLHELINVKPNRASEEVHREVFGGTRSEEAPPRPPNVTRSGEASRLESFRRGADDPLASAGYVGKKVKKEMEINV
ncbi:kinetochore-associated protein NSL1 homolog [Syngnathoides biaculeatus]|uniref:kinetochore-associated protein NSL1 homolog n=1 Tax=Syngnathoides biaculeatus TaxID=300417 RepID=UPI002ADD5989|nr:kinetochore-associated protein NSL1 homolog [Syngnathoides biaculeatus]